MKRPSGKLSDTQIHPDLFQIHAETGHLHPDPFQCIPLKLKTLNKKTVNCKFPAHCHSENNDDLCRLFGNKDAKSPGIIDFQGMQRI
jgi:hypothetical protein